MDRFDAIRQAPMTGERPLDCDAVARQLWDFLDEELTPERNRAIRAHLALCERCFRLRQFEAAFLDALLAARPQHHDPETLERRLRAALAREGFVA